MSERDCKCQRAPLYSVHQKAGRDAFHTAENTRPSLLRCHPDRAVRARLTALQNDILLERRIEAHIEPLEFVHQNHPSILDVQWKACQPSQTTKPSPIFSTRPRS